MKFSGIGSASFTRSAYSIISSLESRRCQRELINQYPMPISIIVSTIALRMKYLTRRKNLLAFLRRKNSFFTGGAAPLSGVFTGLPDGFDAAGVPCSKGVSFSGRSGVGGV